MGSVQVRRVPGGRIVKADVAVFVADENSRYARTFEEVRQEYPELTQEELRVVVARRLEGTG